MASRILPVLIVVVVGLFAASEWISGGRGAGPTPSAGETKAEGYPTELVRVFDGDSLIVRSSNGNEIEIRIHAIDAPERRQPYANASRRALRELLEGEEIVVMEHSRDRYDRVIAKLMVDGRDAGLEQIEGGFAWHYRQFASQQSREDRSLYATAEAKAKERRIGLWARNNPIPPWEYRRQ